MFNGLVKIKRKKKKRIQIRRLGRMRIFAVRPERGVRELDGQLYVRVRGRLHGVGRSGRGWMRGRERVRAVRQRLRHQRQVYKHPRVVHVYVPSGIHRVCDRLLPKLVFVRDPFVFARPCSYTYSANAMCILQNMFLHDAFFYLLLSLRRFFSFFT